LYNHLSLFFTATRKSWNLGNSDWELLHWVARSHEIGMAISHRQYHRHGAYLLRNADLPGFSQDEQEILALLVWCHRRKLPTEKFAELRDTDRTHLLRLVVLLRLANLFKYVEQLEHLPEFRVTAEEHTIGLRFPEQWLEQHPLTAYELREEKLQLTRVGIRIRVG
jgi:exopolyphosphatase/guanosine-5'-triphosphate,3'-diphosphate pyrophosphatase